MSQIANDSTASTNVSSDTTLPAVAQAAAPSYTEGRVVALSTDLAGSLRVSTTPSGTQTVAFSQTGANNDVDILTIAAGDNNIGNVDVVTLPALVAGTANIGDVDVLTVPAPLNVTGTGTEAAALRVTIATDSTGVLSVDDNGGNLSIDDGGNIISVDDGAGSLTIDGTVTANAGTGTFQVGDAGAIINLDASGDVQADILSIAAGDNNIGNVDVVTLPALVAGSANIGDVDIASGPTGTSALQVQGTAAQDAANVGNPVLNGASHETIADAAPTNRLATVTDGDVTRLSATDGALFVIPSGPQQFLYHENSSSALTDTVVRAAPGAGLSLYVTDVVFSTGAATAWNIFFEAPDATTVLGPWYLEAVAGRGATIHFGTPRKLTANTALTVTTSAAIAHSIDVTGFIAPG